LILTKTLLELIESAGTPYDQRENSYYIRWSKS